MLPYTFALFKYTGFWKPLGWYSSWKSKFYNAYTCFAILILCSYYVIDTINLLNSIDDLENLTNNSYIFLSLSGDTRRIRSSYVIYREFLFYGTLTSWYGGVTIFLIGSIVTTSFFENFPDRKLPFDSWLNHSSDSSLTQLFVAYHVYLLFAIGSFAVVDLAMDTFIVGVMCHISGQLKILQHRLLMLPRIVDTTMNIDRLKNSRTDMDSRILERKVLRECIRHHCTIIKLAGSMNDAFTYVIFVQFMISSIAVCFSALDLAKLQLFSPDFMFACAYLLSLLMQIFMLCWYGNNVILQSLDVANAAYEMDWTSLSVSTKKCLLLVMARSLKPIQFTSGHIIVLSIESFNSVMKLSYSIYNVLSDPGTT